MFKTSSYPQLQVDSIFQNIFILENRDDFSQLFEKYSPKDDLVLTLDFGLKKKITDLGGQVYYVDHLCTQDEMQENNFHAAKFLQNWHLDKKGNDIFCEENIPFGFALRIEFWSEYLHYVRLRACLNKLEKVTYNRLYISRKNSHLINYLDDLTLPYEFINNDNTQKYEVYYFDIFKYMHNSLHKKNLSTLIKQMYLFTMLNIRYVVDKLFYRKHTYLYAQIYHPTLELIKHLKKDKFLKIVTASPLKSKVFVQFFHQRMVPKNGFPFLFNKKSEKYLFKLKTEKFHKLILDDGTDISESAYSVIENNIEKVLPKVLQIFKNTNNYVKNIKISLQIMIANIGIDQTLMYCILKSSNVPSFLIINGMLGDQHNDEAKHATYINSYSKSIKDHYFHDRDNVHCLGDPRMDFYINQIPKKILNYNSPTICIGTSGFNNIDLNSYQAIEFEFMDDVLSQLEEVSKINNNIKIIIKVRPNGYIKQYISFVKEYFPKLEVSILQKIPMHKVLRKSDLYISLYSQTLFEASCMGIPVIYYKKDVEINDPPFDGKSELVTIFNKDGLYTAIIDFINQHQRFDEFLDPSIMEKYIGPLDGKNLQRNLDFIYNLLQSSVSSSPK